MNALFLLGLMDLWTSVYIVMLHLGLSTYTVAFLHSAYLFIKAIFYWGDIYSTIDVIVSIYILLMAVGIQNGLITIVACLYLLQKAALSIGAGLKLG